MTWRFIIKVFHTKKINKSPTQTRTLIWRRTKKLNLKRRKMILLKL